MWAPFSQKGRSARPGGRARSHRLQLERLEDRCLLSSGPLDPTFGSGGSVVTPVGTGGDYAYASHAGTDDAAGVKGKITFK